MSDTELKNTTINCLFSADQAVPVDDGDVRVFLDSLKSLHTAAPLTKFDVVRDIVDPTKFSYEFQAADGRKWKQTLWVPVNGEPTMQFTVNDSWKESEFVLHRPVRAVCIALIRHYGISKIKCRW